MSVARIGIDTGGTFTDVILVDEDGLRVHKQPSTPRDPSRAVLEGLRDAGGPEGAGIVHGSTVATNALLERDGARTALLTTAGFEDVLEIGRQARPEIYDLNVERPAPLVAAEHRIGVEERVGPDGNVLTPLQDDEVAACVRRVLERDVESVAVCLLHSYAHPEHERRLTARLREEFDGFVTASHEVLPEFREYERCSTTTVNAYVGPVMDGYLERLDRELEGRGIRVMQSNGGSITLETARRQSVHTILSGPAGGVVGGFEIGRIAGHDRIITFDMGGTSTDVSLCDGSPARTAEATIGGLPIRVPVIDIHTVGAGGGSIATRDPGGALRVGPRSAGADPGPVCYGAGGTEITVSDANLWLGRLVSDRFLGGEQRLQEEPTAEAMEELADAMGLSPTECAEGVLEVANTTMEGAIRVISVERGFDPGDFTLVSFGGAGAMHAAALARRLSIPRVVVPRAAGVLSALGMLLADIVRDSSRTLLAPTEEAEATDLEARFRELEEDARRELAREGLEVSDMRSERAVDMRYVGQGYELEVPFAEELEAAFHDRHRQRFGYADPGRDTEIVNLRVRTVVPTDQPEFPPRELVGADAAAAILDRRTAVFSGERVETTLYERRDLAPGNELRGPALVLEYSTTTVVPPDVLCRVDEWENLVLEVEGP